MCNSDNTALNCHHESKENPQTNAERIREMTDEKLAIWLNENGFNCPPADCPGEDCIGCWLNWLQSTV